MINIKNYCCSAGSVKALWNLNILGFLRLCAKISFCLCDVDVDDSSFASWCDVCLPLEAVDLYI